ncbi:VOC family protein [Erythrobacter sp. SCSIO 43205]|uniref:VOC family protein n=1 Tax=Erythrobacter sp. SCSIO 43205 TaxID=2779361 RepID=UPI001CA9A724|nr:VOC family protein [Erythrobacter sp. SCSIO 43205]UAB77107.1 VOC family protein [Erythrobacter sp. SCSIO 43205]
MRLNQVTVGCTDYAASVDFYRKLGLTLIVDAPPRYARFETPHGETFSLHEVDAVLAPTTVVYFEIEGLDETVAALKGAGLTFISDPVDQSWGWREARLADPAGNEICLFWGGRNRRFPPWRVETSDGT